MVSIIRIHDKLYLNEDRKNRPLEAYKFIVSHCMNLNKKMF